MRGERVGQRKTSQYIRHQVTTSVAPHAASQTLVIQYIVHGPHAGRVAFVGRSLALVNERQAPACHQSALVECSQPTPLVCFLGTPTASTLRSPNEIQPVCSARATTIKPTERDNTPENDVSMMNRPGMVAPRRPRTISSPPTPLRPPSRVPRRVPPPDLDLSRPRLLRFVVQIPSNVFPGTWLEPGGKEGGKGGWWFKVLRL